jgi:hypothetical protein
MNNKTENNRQMANEEGGMWVFHGEKSDFCTAIFTNKLLAEEWISKYSLTGNLTRMPINESIYDWAIKSDMFEPKKDYQKTATFIQQFTSAYLEHYHYVNGHNDDNYV